MFHKEGYKIMIVLALVLLALNIIIWLAADILWVKDIILIASLIFFILVSQFFRNPKRNTEADDDYVTAPVDGKVVIIQEVYEKEYFKDKRLQISTFMSPINVHVTRYPVNGEVTYSKYHPGKYLVAWHPKSSEKNERTTVVVKNESFGEILYRQVAGAMARRIVNYAKIGDKVIQGSDSGFIKFGSRVDVFLPPNTQVDIALNQKVKGGITRIAKWNSHETKGNQ